jgi:hypothetical protein
MVEPRRRHRRGRPRTVRQEFRGPRGGEFHIGPSGEKIYKKRHRRARVMY